MNQNAAWRIVAQRKYKQFDQRRRITITTLIVFQVGILLCCATAFGFVDENPTPLLLFTGILLVYTAIAIFVCRYFTIKHGELYVAAYGNDSNIIHSGLFGEIWEEFEWNQFEGLTDGKVPIVFDSAYAASHKFDWQLHTVADLMEILNEFVSKYIEPAINGSLELLGSQQYVWKHCFCKRACCDHCWVENNHWEAKAVGEI